MANDDLSTEGSDQSKESGLTSSPRPKRQVEPVLENLDDVSTEGPSSVEGNNSPKTDDEFEESKNALSDESEQNEAVTSVLSSDDAVNKLSTDDSSSDKVGKSRESELLPEDNVENIYCSSKSSMEVMEDESDATSSESNSTEKVIPNSDAAKENSSADVIDAANENCNADVTEAIPETSTGSGSEIISQNAPLNSVNSETNEKDPEVGDILTMDDSDVDESLQQNLDVAMKVVEENQASPIGAEEPETAQTDDDSINKIDSLETSDPISKSRNILDEFQEDAAQINGDSSESLDSRLSPCQVVLFKIDFDEYALKHLKNNTETVQSSSDRSTGSNSDSSISESPLKSPPLRGRVLTKAARKMIPPPETIKKTPSPRVRNSRISSKITESTRPRRKTKDAVAKGLNYVFSSSSDTDDEVVPLISPNEKRKVVANSSKRSARTARKSDPKPGRSQKNGLEEIENFDNELSVDLSNGKTLRSVSIPIITDLIDSFKEKSCDELIALIEQRADKLPSRTTRTKSKSKEHTTVERSPRKIKLSSSETSRSSTSSDISKSPVDDDDYKTYGKMWRYDEGTSRNDNKFSLRSEAKSTSNKRPSRKSAKVRSYVEDSGSDDESPLKKTRTSTKNPTGEVTSEKKDTDGSDKEAENLSSECFFFFFKFHSNGIFITDFVRVIRFLLDEYSINTK